MTAHPLTEILANLHSRWMDDRSGDVADYIPELAKVDPDRFAIALATSDGAIYTAGDARDVFTIQSMSKPFAFAAGLDRFGHQGMLRHVGVEPTGDAFNAIVLDDVNRRPFNPMVNAGAIAVSALFEGSSGAAKSAKMLDRLSAFAGRALEIDDDVFRSEAETGHRNRAIAYLMLNGGMLASDVDSALETYFRQCSVKVDTCDLAVMAATLANGGINPRTGIRAVGAEHVARVLTVMLTCGMYDYAGQWAYEVGLPAKSGVSGGVLMVVPGQFGLAAFSPRLDRYGNSVRAVQACREFVSRLSLHGLERPMLSPPGGGLPPRFGARSRRWRSAAERMALDEAQDRIAILDATGVVTVAAAERIVRDVHDLMLAGKAIVVDMRRTTAIDAGAAVLLDGLFRSDAIDRGFVAVVAPAGRQLAGLAAAKLMDGPDPAIEAAENHILGETAITAPSFAPDLGSVPFLKDLDAAEFSRLRQKVTAEAVVYPGGHVIVRQNDPSDAVFLMLAGSVTVRIAAGEGSHIRINALGPGATFGEMALIDGAARSADVVADQECRCLRIPYAPLKAFLEEDPAIRAKVLTALLSDLGGRIRSLNQVITALYD